MRPPQNILGRLLVLFVVLLVSTTGATAITAPPTSGASMTHIDSCGTIDSSGTYLLTENLTDSAATGCIQITADDVQLHGGAHQISTNANSSRTAIVATDVDGVTVEGFHLIGWQTGVKFRDVDGGHITGNAFTNVSVAAITLESRSSNVTISLNDVTRSTTGVHITEATGVTVADNQLSNLTGTGIVAERFVTHSRIVGNSVRNASGGGIHLSKSSRVAVTGNHLDSNGVSGITVTESGRITLGDNWVTNTGGTGIEVIESVATRVRNNSVTKSAFNGIAVVGGNRSVTAALENVVVNNTVSGAGNSALSVSSTTNVTVNANRFVGSGDGIKLNATRSVSITNNTVTDNRDDGVVLVDTSNATVSGNNVSANTDNGIYFLGANNTFARNVISSNGDDGLDGQNARGSEIVDNVVTANGDDGIFFRNTTQTRVVGNRIYDNHDDGVDLRNSGGNHIQGNQIYGNGQYEIQVREGSPTNEIGDN